MSSFVLQKASSLPAFVEGHVYCMLKKFLVFGVGPDCGSPVDKLKTKYLHLCNFFFV